MTQSCRHHAISGQKNWPSFSVWQKRLYALVALLLVALSVPARADCELAGTYDPVTGECIAYEEDPRLLPPLPYRKERFKVTGKPYCDVAVEYPVFSIPILDEKIKDWIMGHFERARNECPDATTPEAALSPEWLNIIFKTLRPSSCVLVVYFEAAIAGGGGRPYGFRKAFNYDLVRHTFLNLNDLLENTAPMQRGGSVWTGEAGFPLSEETPFFLIPGGIMSHSDGGGYDMPYGISMEQLQPYRPVQRYWSREGCSP